MEKNTVNLSVEKYNALLKENFDLEHAFERCQEEIGKAQSDFKALSVFAIEQVLKEWLFKAYSLEELLNFDSFSSAINKEDVNTLINLGVPYSLIVQVIKKTKEEIEEEHNGNE